MIMEIEKLIDKEIPAEIIEIFKERGITKLDQFQEDAINEGLLEGKNLLISAPTSSGKTLIGELALIKHALLPPTVVASLTRHFLFPKKCFCFF